MLVELEDHIAKQPISDELLPSRYDTSHERALEPDRISGDPLVEVMVGTDGVVENQGIVRVPVAEEVESAMPEGEAAELIDHVGVEEVRSDAPGKSDNLQVGDEREEVHAGTQSVIPLFIGIGAILSLTLAVASLMNGGEPASTTSPEVNDWGDSSGISVAPQWDVSFSPVAPDDSPGNRLGSYHTWKVQKAVSCRLC